MSDNLEELDNKSLHEKCQAYGLPNIPVTDTSRKLLIRKLRSAIENGVQPVEKAPTTLKNRRETVHVIKIQTEDAEKDDADKQKVRNRRTMGTPKVVLERMPVELEEKINAPDKKAAKIQTKNRETPTLISAVDPKPPQRRRSTRASPMPQPEPVIEVTQTKKRYDELLEEDEENFAQFVPGLERSLSRASRSSSLSKSPVVTTSYVNQTANIIDLDDEDDDSEPEVTHVGIPLRSGFAEAPSYSPYKSFETAKPPSTGAYSMRYSTGAVRQSPMRSTLEKSTTAKHSYEPNVTHRQTTATTSRSIPVNEYIKSLTQSSEDKENCQGSDLEHPPPFLSKFVQRISNLQAEPLSPSISSPLRSTGSNLVGARFKSSSINARRGISQDHLIRDSFYSFLAALDQKYNLKATGILCGVLLLIVVIYFFFF